MTQQSACQVQVGCFAANLPSLQCQSLNPACNVLPHCLHLKSDPKSSLRSGTAAAESPACTAPSSLLQHALCCLQCPKITSALDAAEPAPAGMDNLPGPIPYKALLASPAVRAPPDAAASLTATESHALAGNLTAMSARLQSAAAGSGVRAPQTFGQQAAEAWVPAPIDVAHDSSGAARQPPTAPEGSVAAAAVEPADAPQQPAAAGGVADTPKQAAAAGEPPVTLKEAAASALEQAVGEGSTSREAPLLLADSLACLVRSCSGVAATEAGPADGAASGSMQGPPAEEQDGTGDAGCSAKEQHGPCQSAAEEPILQACQLDENTRQGSLAVAAPAPSPHPEISAEEAAGPEAAASTAGCSKEAAQPPVMQKDQPSLPWQEQRPATCPQRHKTARLAATEPQACYEAAIGGGDLGSTPTAESDTGASPAARREGHSCLQPDSVSSHLAPLAPSESSDVELSDVDLSELELEPVPGPTAAASASAAVAAAPVEGRQTLSDVELSLGDSRHGPACAAAVAAAVAAAAAMASRRQGVSDQGLSDKELEAVTTMAEPGTAALCLHWVEAPSPVLL